MSDRDWSHDLSLTWIVVFCLNLAVVCERKRLNEKYFELMSVP